MRSFRKTIGLMLTAMALSCGTAASADTFYLSQSGFSGGGKLTGYFVGNDIDGDGLITAFPGSTVELTDYHLDFKGDANIPDFSHGMSDFYGIVYVVGSGQIGGNPPVPGGEGLASNWPNPATGYSYAAGPGPARVAVGAVITAAGSGITTSTIEPLLVSLVPEPAAGTLAMFGLAVLGIRLLRQSRQRQLPLQTGHSSTGSTT